MLIRIALVWFLIALGILPAHPLEAQLISVDSLLLLSNERYKLVPDSAVLFLTLELENYPSPLDRLRINEKIILLNSLPGMEFQTFHALTKLHFELGEARAASLYGDSAQHITFQEMNLANLRELFRTRHAISFKMGEPYKALAFFKLFAKFRDSVRTIGYEQRIDSLKTNLTQAGIDADIRRAELALQLEKTERDRIRQWKYFQVMIAGVFVLFILIFVYRYRINTRTASLLREKEAKLQELNSLTDRMFTVIGHDLRGPLSTYNNLTRSLAENLGKLGKGEVEGYLRNMHAAGVDLSRLLNNLLEWALIQTGSIPFKPETFNCKLLALEVQEHLRPMASEKDLKIEFLIPDTQHAFGDRGMIAIVMRTLLSNAIRFTPGGRSITIFSGRKDDLITLGVKDNGVGMSADKLQHIFQQETGVGQQRSSAKKVAGIGLQLCKDLISKNGGNFYAESRANEGSAFYFSLPESPLS